MYVFICDFQPSFYASFHIHTYIIQFICARKISPRIDPWIIYTMWVWSIFILTPSLPIERSDYIKRRPRALWTRSACSIKKSPEIPGFLVGVFPREKWKPSWNCTKTLAGSHLLKITHSYCAILREISPALYLSPFLSKVLQIGPVLPAISACGIQFRFCFWEILLFSNLSRLTSIYVSIQYLQWSSHF